MLPSIFYYDQMYFLVMFTVDRVQLSANSSYASLLAVFLTKAFAHL